MEKSSTKKHSPQPPGATLSEPILLLFALVLLELFRSKLLTEGQVFDLLEKVGSLTCQKKPFRS